MELYNRIRAAIALKSIYYLPRLKKIVFAKDIEQCKSKFSEKDDNNIIKLNIFEYFVYVLTGTSKYPQKKLDEYLKEQIAIRDTQIKDLKEKLDKLKYVEPIENRKLKIEETSSKRSKLTISPVSGRVSLKLSNKSSERVKNDILYFVKNIIINEEFPPFTFRGNFSWKIKKQCYEICLQSQNKITKKFNYSPLEQKNENQTNS